MTAIFLFELKTWMRRPLVYLFFFFLWALAFIVTAVPQIPIGNSTGNTLINAPVIISKTILILTSVGMLMIAAIVSSSVIKDRETGFSKIYYSFPFTKSAYFFGKYLSGFLLVIIIFSAIPLGVLTASYMPWLSADKVGSFEILHYLHAITFWMIPNLFFMSALFFTMTSISRSNQLVYVSGVVVYAVYLVSYFSVSRFTDFTVAALFDPFAILTEEYVSNQWTVNQQNTLLVPLNGIVLQNRMMYTFLGVLLLLGGFFKIRLNDEARLKGKKAKVSDFVPSINSKLSVIEGQNYTSEKNLSLLIKQLFFRSFLEFKMTVANRFFLIILLATFLILLITNWSLYSNFGIPIAKYTSAMIEAKEGPFPMFLLLILVIYAGDLIHRDRKNKFDGLNDSLPVSDWVFMVSKLLNLFYITALMFSTIIVAGIVVQVLNGFYILELGVYLIDNFLFSLPIYFFFAIIIFFLHIIAPNEYIGHAFVLIFWLSRGAILSLGIEDHLIHFGRLPEHFYSEINGFYPFSITTFWFFIYWTLVSFILFYFALLLWKRGENLSLMERIKNARLNINNKVVVSSFILWLTVGGFIYFQIHYKNDSLTEQELESLNKDKKDELNTLKLNALPKVNELRIVANHFPEERRHELNLDYTIKNETDKEIDTLLISLPPKNAYDFDFQFKERAYEIIYEKKELGIFSYSFTQPLKPGESRKLKMKLVYRIKGFNDLTFNHQNLPNQSFFSLNDLPQIGFGKGFSNTNIYLECNVENKYQVISSFPLLTKNNLNEGNKKISFEGMVSDSFGWYVFKGLKSKSFLDKDFEGNVYYHSNYEKNADHAIKAIKEIKQFLDTKKLSYPVNTFSLIQQARGFDKFINTHIGISGFDETFGWRMSDIEEKEFDFFKYFIAREMMRSFLEHKWSALDKSNSTFLINAFAEYFAFDFYKENKGLPALDYLKRRHNRYLSQRPKVKESAMINLSASKNSVKGLFALVGISKHIGRNEFNEKFYDFIRNTELDNDYSGNDLMNRFQYLVEDNITENAKIYVQQSIKETLFYDNKVESVISNKQGNEFVNKIKLHLKKSDQQSKTSNKEVYEIRLLANDGSIIKSVEVGFSLGENTIEIKSNQKPNVIELDPFYTVMDLNRNNNRYVVY